MSKLKLVVSLLVASGLASPVAHATNGYFSHGYGMKAKGMAGASTAMTNDTFGGANNPASMVWVGSRMDIGIEWFKPIRSSERTGATDPTMNGSANSDSEDFAIPEFGYNRMLNPNMSVGMTVYGNGGMNTNYAGGQLPFGGTCANGGGTGFNPVQVAGGTYNLLCGDGRLGVDMMQLVIAPTVSYKINETNSIGLSPLLGYQRFKAEGLQAFSGFSADANNLTNKGYDDATGYGVRIGWLGKVNDAISLGAAYSTKINYSKFDKYKGLFAEEGDFDTPVNWNIGIAIKATPTLLLAADYQQIDYSGVNSVGNASTISGATIASTLGPSNGRGFGWEDTKVVKLGAEYIYNSSLTLRAGYSHADSPITSRDVTFNMIAPGVVEDHYTLGFTYTLANKSEITMAYMHAKENSVTGSSLFNTWTGSSGTERIRMHQNSLGIAYGWKM